MKKILLLLSFVQFGFSLAQSDITVGGTSAYNNALGVYKFYNSVNGKPSYIRLIKDASQYTTESECAGGPGVGEEFYMILWTGSDWKWQRFYYEGGSLFEWFLGECVIKSTYEEFATSYIANNLSTNISITPTPPCNNWSGSSTPSFSESDCSVVSNLGLDNNISKKNLIYYPTPTKDIFNIKFNKTISTVDLSLLDMSGKVLLKKSYDNTKDIALEITQPKGVYFVKLSNKDSMDVMIKVIKE